MHTRSPCVLVRALAMAAVCLVSAAPVRAQDSLPLTEVLEVIKGEPQLVGQIEVEVRRRDLKVQQIVCIAARHGAHRGLRGAHRRAVERRPPDPPARRVHRPRRAQGRAPRGSLTQSPDLDLPPS